MSVKLKLIIAGGRDFTSRKVVLDALCSIIKAKGLKKSEVEIVSGLAKGPDTIGLQIAMDNGMPYKKFKADWKDITREGAVIRSNKYGKYDALAGIKRNHDMGDYAEELLAIWDGVSTGTEDMITYMQKLGKEVTIVTY
tara:strand:+ start:50 stop:466 length:417 start_codon:yes stop_codon:yes gene_type:complete